MNNQKTKTLAGMGLLIATVVVLQLIGQYIKFGPFSISLVLVPIIIGSALYGPWAGGVLGFVFSVIVLMTDAGAFLAYSPIGTVITVLAKGTCAGLASGAIYKTVENKSSVAVLLASITAPVVNTGLFVVGCFVFFIPLLETWAGGTNVVSFILFGMIGTNFLVEMVINVALSNVIARLIKIGKKNKLKSKNQFFYKD